MDPMQLIKEYRDRIAVLQKEIDSHPFKYMVGFRFNDASNFAYRWVREQEQNRLREKIKEEEIRYQLLQHNILNKNLKEKGIEVLKEQPKPIDNFVRVVNEGNPIGIALNKIGAPIASGIGSAVSSPFIWIAVIVGAIFILPMIFKRL